LAPKRKGGIFHFMKSVHVLFF